MIFTPLFTNLLLAAATLAGPGAPRARSPAAFMDWAIDASGNGVDVAGAVWGKPPNTFKSVTGALTVPKVTGEDGSAARALVGFGVPTSNFMCGIVTLRTGITFRMLNGGVSYDAFYQWFPEPLKYLPGVPFSEGDVVRFTVAKNTATSANVTVENITRGKKTTERTSSTHALCGSTVEWFIQDDTLQGKLAPIPDFGTVTFYNATAETVQGDHLEPSGATVVNMVQNGVTLASAHSFLHGVNVAYEGSM